jgi:outer membrane receptor protein involved in Fe transport
LQGSAARSVIGNAALKPEQADTYSLGLTLTPTMLPGFTASIDYWHMAFFDLIGVYPGATLFDIVFDDRGIRCSAVRSSVTTSPGL